MLSSIIAVGACMGGSAAVAQPSAVPAAVDTAVAGLEEITVTAQRRSESINDVGIAIVASSGMDLVDKGIGSPADLVKIVPGLTYTETPYGTGVLTLRGIGFYESSMAASSTVALYVDEIPLSYPRMAAGTTLDIERVEVLKGPQGTLYGQNSTGGLVNYIAAKPTDTLETGVDASFGRFRDIDASGFLSGPIADNLSARLAVRTRQSDDWQVSATRDDEIGSTNMVMARLLVDWVSENGLAVGLNANGFIDKSDSQAAQAIGLFPGVPAAVRPQELAATLIPTGRNRVADWDEGEKFSKDNKLRHIGLRATLPVGAAGDLISITSYAKYTQDQRVDADGTNIETATASQDGYIKAFSQELRLQGQTERVKYVLGGNYSSDSIYDNTVFEVADSSLAYTVPVLPITQARTYSRQKAKTWAAFASADYDLTARLTLQGGLRYTKQDRDFSGCIGDNGDGAWALLFSVAYQAPIAAGACTTFNPFTGVIGPVSDTLDEDNLSWRGNLNFKVTPNALLYASVSRGYKSGSFPTVGGILSIQYTPAKQESVLSSEVGAKLTLADNRIQLNADLFYYDYTDKQFRGKIVDSFFGSIERLYNVPKSEVKGFEVQLVAAPTDRLRFEASVTHSDSNIDSSFAGLTPVGTPANLEGETFEFTPKWAASGGLSYEMPLARPAVTAFAGVSGTYQSRSHAGYGGLPIFKLPAYGLVDARLGARSSDQRWAVQVWVHNLFDRYYLTNANYLGDFAYRLAGRPRTYGISVRVRN